PEERCSIHHTAPFGCSYFDHTMVGPEGDLRSQTALVDILYDIVTHGPYVQLWLKLAEAGREVEGPMAVRAKLRDALERQQPLDPSFQEGDPRYGLLCLSLTVPPMEAPSDVPYGMRLRLSRSATDRR